MEPTAAEFAAMKPCEAYVRKSERALVAKPETLMALALAEGPKCVLEHTSVSVGGSDACPCALLCGDTENGYKACGECLASGVRCRPQPQVGVSNGAETPPCCPYATTALPCYYALARARNAPDPKDLSAAMPRWMTPAAARPGATFGEMLADPAVDKTPEADGAGGGLPTEAWVGIAIGGAVILALSVYGIVYAVRRSREKSEAAAAAAATAAAPAAAQPAQ